MDSGTGGYSGSGGAVFCYVDFPCLVDSWCVADDPGVRMIGYDISCSDFCGNQPCSGMSCSGSPEPCDQGAVCVNIGKEYGPFGAECRPKAEVCGGPNGIACPAGGVCDFGAAKDGFGSGPPEETAASGMYGLCVPGLEAGGLDAGSEASDAMADPADAAAE